VAVAAGTGQALVDVVLAGEACVARVTATVVGVDAIYAGGVVAAVDADALVDVGVAEGAGEAGACAVAFESEQGRLRWFRFL
jgi:hypothetical protein